MNYYQHHIGDFRSGTIHFTRLMRWIYRDMIEVYYDREKPLPLALDALHDLLGTYQDDEAAAVQRILRIKFEQRETGWHHTVCDETIEAYKAAAEEAAAVDAERRENEAERQRRSRARRSELFKRLRDEFDIVPPFDIHMKQLQSLLDYHVESRNSGRTYSGNTGDITSTSHDVTRDGCVSHAPDTGITINQEPLTKNQEPSIEKKSPALPGQSPSDPISPVDNSAENPASEAPEKAARRKLVSTEEDQVCARWVYERLLRVNPAALEPNWNAWGNTIRLMREIDGRTHRQICELFEWVTKDTFWCQNVQCPETLRKQYDRLVVVKNVRPASTLANKASIYEQGMSEAAKAKELIFGSNKQADAEVIDAGA
jgi:uncharacterized protein YdaU (DUF1376 family)